MPRVLPTDIEHGWYLGTHPREYTDNAADNRREHQDFCQRDVKSS